MSMKDAILDFNKQFEYEPKIENQENLSSEFENYLLVGMGGSHLKGDLLRLFCEEIKLDIYLDYGIHNRIDKKTLVILSSYSGNTEEVLEALEQAIKENCNLLIISTGGKLIEIAKQKNLPYIQLPNTGIQPRNALGLSLMALLKATNHCKHLDEISKLSKILDPASFENKGKELAQDFKGFIPVIYSSNRNKSISYNWKIKLNETGKIPSFYNVIPELNHNEMQGFDIDKNTRDLVSNLKFIFIKDSQDHPKIQKRFEVIEKLYKDRGLGVETINLEGTTIYEKAFSSLLIADWFAFYTAKTYGREPESVPMIEEFKKLL